MDHTAHYISPLGGITLAGTGDALTGLWFDGQKYFGSTLSADHTEKDLYFSGTAPGFTPPLLLRASDFRISVWNILLTIPYGRTVTYGEIAAILSAERGMAKMSAQAVGNAVGHNPVSLIIPCHRVIGKNGSLTGYAGGIDIKRRLLALEGVDPGVPAFP